MYRSEQETEDFIKHRIIYEKIRKNWHTVEATYG